jgi:hypothetical protein
VGNLTKKSFSLQELNRIAKIYGNGDSRDSGSNSRRRYLVRNSGIEGKGWFMKLRIRKYEEGSPVKLLLI